ncbi:hypothetical protein HDU86_004454 [Geranomyces michiganensis]|nr:hypothetical protein HDU86_004454 [Geranomyces michiganensis]
MAQASPPQPQLQPQLHADSHHHYRHHRLATPPPTPPAPRKTSSAIATAVAAAPSPPSLLPSPPPPPPPQRGDTVVELPMEIWAQVFAHLAVVEASKTAYHTTTTTTPHAPAAASLLPLLTVCRAWHAEAERLLYRSITFTSLAQRNRFAVDRLCCYDNNVVPTPSPQSTSASTTPASSPPTTPTITPANTLPSTPVTTPNSIALLHPHPSLRQHVSSPSSAPSPASDVPYGAWQNRTISPLLVLVAARMLNLTYLGLAGCRFDDGVFADALAIMCNLTVLDLAGSNVRRHGLNAVATYATKLVRLDLSGIFRFRRIPSQHLTDIASACSALATLAVRNCPDLSAAVRAQAMKANPLLTIRWSGFDFESVETATAAVAAAAAAADAATSPPTPVEDTAV